MIWDLLDHVRVFPQMLVPGHEYLQALQIPSVTIAAQEIRRIHRVHAHVLGVFYGLVVVPGLVLLVRALRLVLDDPLLCASDPQAAYCARIFDNYFWRFCILIFLLKRWEDLKEAMDNDRVQTWFRREKVDEQTAREAWYLCEYYFQNTQPFLRSLSENARLDEEKKIVRILQKADGQQLAHSRLLCKCMLTAREFRGCIESLIEKQAIVAHELDSGYKNRVSLVYSLNPALNDLDIN